MFIAVSRTTRFDHPPQPNIKRRRPYSYHINAIRLFCIETIAYLWQLIISIYSISRLCQPSSSVVYFYDYAINFLLLNHRENTVKWSDILQTYLQPTFDANGEY
jgi:hypothetical protein